MRDLLRFVASGHPAVPPGGPRRAAFIEPLFFITMMVRFHIATEGQAINPDWDARLSAISDKFRSLGRGAAEATGRSRCAKMWS